MLTATTHRNVSKVKTSTNTGSELTHEFQIMAIASKFTEHASNVQIFITCKSVKQ